MNYILPTTTAAHTGFYLKVQKAGTTFTFWISSDGIGWMRFFVTSSDDVVPTRIGLGVNESANSGLVKFHVDYFRKTA